MKKVYLATLYRFGYDLTAIGKTEAEAKNTIMEEYVRAFKEANDDIDPEEYGHDEDTTYYENAEEDVEIMELTFGKVEWR